MNRQAAAILLLWLAIAGRPATAGDRTFISGGDASSRDFYTYAGVVIPGPSWRDGKGFFQRYWLDRFGYEYRGGPGKVEARAWGGEAAIGYVSPTSHGWWSASIGARHTNTSLSPDDRNASARGAQTGPKLQIQVERSFHRDWRIAAIASYTLQQNQYWARSRLLRGLTPALSAGVDVTLNGNDETDSVGTAAVLIWSPRSAPWSLGLKTGYIHRDVGDGIFAGVELGRAF